MYQQIHGCTFNFKNATKIDKKVQPNAKSLTRYWIHGCIFSKQKVQPKVQPLSNRTQKSATNTVLPKKVQPKSATKR